MTETKASTLKQTERIQAGPGPAAGRSAAAWSARRR